MSDVSKIEINGGVYEGQEQLLIEHKEGRIVITGWYEGGCKYDVGVNMPVEEFMRRLHLPNDQAQI